MDGTQMASTSRQKTTMAKLNRERALRERRELKRAKKDARKRAAAAGVVEVDEATAPESADDGERPDADADRLE
jgi:hypothetical protein